MRSKKIVNLLILGFYLVYLLLFSWADDGKVWISVSFFLVGAVILYLTQRSQINTSLGLFVSLSLMMSTITRLSKGIQVYETNESVYNIEKDFIIQSLSKCNMNKMNLLNKCSDLNDSEKRRVLSLKDHFYITNENGELKVYIRKAP